MYNQKIGEISSQVQKEFSGLNLIQLNYKPGIVKWSIAQCFDHLIVTSETYVPVFKKLSSDTFKMSFIQRFNPLTGLFGKKILQAMKTDSSRSNAPSIFHPSESDIPVDIIDRFLTSQRELGSLFVIFEKKRLENQVISSPLSKLVTLKLADAMDIIIEHEKRHLRQARRVREELLN
jgi:hypothetical protein